MRRLASSRSAPMKRRGTGQADRTRHVLGSAAARPLLPSAVDQGDHLGHPTSDVQGTNPLGAVDLVPRDGQEIHTQRLDMDGNLAESLDRIGVEQDVPLAAHLGDLGDREEHSRLVVGVHEADQNRVRPDRSSHLVRIQHTLAVHRQPRDRAPLTLQMIGGMEDGVMLDRRDDEMARATGSGSDDPRQGQIIRLGPTPGENDAVLVGDAQGPRHTLSCGLQGVTRLTPPGVDRTRVPEPLPEEGQHGREDIGVERRGRVVIQIDSHRGAHFRPG